VKKIIVFGSTGMIGSAVSRELIVPGYKVYYLSRSTGIPFDALAGIDSLLQQLRIQEHDFIVNCVGLTKGRIQDDSPQSRNLAVNINYVFPNVLDYLISKYGYRLISPATDCVFSGREGSYSEHSPHDPTDVYGKTKSLGEVPNSNSMYLRCSIIGSEEFGRNSLFFEWLRQLERNASIKGYVNHLWNGITSDVFGKIVKGIIETGSFKSGVQHIVPEDTITKDSLIRLVLKALGREDVTVTSVLTERAVDRSLVTENREFNAQLFAAAGFCKIPSIRDMVLELCSN
jgi:dTDP-4-dehydrorhamnose reductase